eukprot:gene10553-14178_t
MFAKSSNSNEKIGSLVTEYTKLYDSTLGLRVSLQKVVDEGNKLPLFVADDNNIVSNEEYNSLQSNAKTLLKCLAATVDLQVDNNDHNNSKLINNNKRKREDNDLSWDDIIAPQTKMMNKWEIVLNRWHARLNFGSESVKSKMKVFNHSLTQQVDDLLLNNQRIIEKSRIPFNESLRFGLLTPDERINSKYDYDDNQEVVKLPDGMLYDMEVYDDRSFYATLLKTFISNSATSGYESGMRGDDIAALRKYKRKKENVERKASKGRKIRYKVHPKLQNFTFPIPCIPPAGLDVELLHASLFQ